MNAEQVKRRALEKLALNGTTPELSPQANAVIDAMVEEIKEWVRKNKIETQPEFEATPSGRMQKPTIEAVIQYGCTIELPRPECEKMFAYYESNGWRVGKNPMKSWTAAMRNWKCTCQSRRTNGHISSSVELIRDQNALVRVELRLKEIRGQFPLPANDPRRGELARLKDEQARLKAAIGFKV